MNPSPKDLHTGINRESLTTLKSSPIYTSYTILKSKISFILQETADIPHTQPCDLPSPSFLHTVFVAINGNQIGFSGELKQGFHSGSAAS